ncbi:MAG: UDP-N-acetylmuramoyl-tripeptide--D-alanyl-D-alanine ligase [Planctomycetota bacterium]
MTWTLGEFVAAAGGAPTDATRGLSAELAGVEVGGVVIDSRAVVPGVVFVALPGERTDGHDHVAAALAAGALAAVVERAVEGVPADRLIVVDDAIAALARLADAYRDRLAAGGCKVIAVVGSNGKTSTRHTIFGLLNGRHVRRPTELAAEQSADDPATWAMRPLVGTEAQASFNNAIGVPVTLLNARGGDDYVVCEIGTNAPGETDALARLVRPDAVVLTSIGAEHLEGFGDLAGVAREEAAVLDHLRDGGVVVADAAAWSAVVDAVPGAAERGLAVVTVGEAGALQTRNAEFVEDGVVFDLAVGDAGDALLGALVGVGWFVPQYGAWSAGSAAMALVVGRWLGVDATQLRHGLAAAVGMPRRMERLVFGGRAGEVVVWDDAYNANPDSMRHALDHVERLGRGGPSKRRERLVVVLGDMLELGAGSAAEHAAARARVAGLIERGVVDAAHWVGERMGGAADDGAIEAIVASIEPGDEVVLKASRDTRLVRVVEGLRTRFGVPASSVDGLGTGSGVVLGR